MSTLNLCLDETMNKNFTEEDEEGDVIFVKEYKTKSSSDKCQKAKTLRRNPTRKARDSNRFSDYVEKSYGQDENSEESPEPDDEENKQEDCDDWKIEKIPRRGRSRGFFSRRTRLRKRKPLGAGNNKASLKDLEDLIESNFLLTTKYIRNMLSQITENGSKRIEHAVDIVKNQVVLVAMSKGLQEDGQLCKHLASLE